jgi:multiple sugar transport system ATP-binding protein
MNFIEGVLADGAEGTVFSSASGFTVPFGRRLAVECPRPVILGIRPEHFAVTENGTPTEVVVVETTGSATQVNVRRGTDELVCEFRERVLPRPGEMLRISPLPEAIHLFDAQTGQRVIEREHSLSA